MLFCATTDRMCIFQLRAFALVSLSCLFISCTAASAAAPPRLADWVDTRRGTHSEYHYSRGNTFPATALPFGFNFWTPISEGNSDRWLYKFASNTLQGIGVSHEPSPWMADYGTLQIWPGVGDIMTDPQLRQVGYSHDGEVARPYEYRVNLDNGIRMRLTPTDHAALLGITYPPSSAHTLLFDNLCDNTGHLTADANSGVISGFTERAGARLFVYAEVHGAQIAAVSAQGPLGVRLTPPAGEVMLHIATSWISVDQARSNLQQEVGAQPYGAVLAAAVAAWEKALGRIDIDGASVEERQIFYANLYRAQLYPNSRWELVQGAPHYHSPYNNRVQPGKMWVNNGFWDTHRAAWPLYMLLLPQQTGEMLNGFVQAFHEGGWTPRWTSPGYRDVMVGTHTDIIFADAYRKNIPGLDVQGAYASALKNATVDSRLADRGRKGNQRSVFLGYIPTDAVPEAAAWYLEDRLNDYGAAVLAEAVGRPAEAAYLQHRALNYVNLFSPQVGFFRGRKADGNWRTLDPDFKPHEWGWEFTEGCAWHYATPAPHDPRGMANLYGGLPQLASKIDSVFAASRDYLPGSYGQPIHEMREGYDANMGQYAHANEPIQHMIYMYNYAGMPWKTQARVRAVLDPNAGLYTAGIDNGGGYLGDEDNGQMSAWYLFSALGFYPASVGRPEYALGSPLFARAALHLSGGKDFVVEALNNSAQNVYIQSATLDGQPFTRNFITHAEVVRGGQLRLTMGPEPSTWGSGAQDLPTSITTGARPPQPWRDVSAAAVRRVHGDPQTAALAFDDDSGTALQAADRAVCVHMEWPAAAAPTVQAYTLTSADDALHDPSHWTLQGSQDGTHWTDLDRRSAETFTWRRQTKVFQIATPAAYAQLRLDVGAEKAAVHVAEVEMLAQ